MLKTNFGKTIILVSKFEFMLCFSPIKVVNQQRFICSDNSDKLYNYVRCGQCASCQQIKAAEWIFRSFKHFEDCVNKDGFVLFDCLTYSDKFVPHLKDYDGFADLPANMNYMCFSYSDIRKFNVRLRRNLSRLGFGSGVYDYFITCEYGSDERYTHRPHYHVLFYVYSDIDPLVFSRLVAKSWQKGRTDGLPFKSVPYVQGNIFRSLSVGGRRVCNYVSKYVQKSSAFEKIVNKRVNKVLEVKFPFEKRKSFEARKVRRDLKRVVCQFHRQSHGFGLSAIDDINVDELFNRGFFKMPNGKPTMYSRVPISQYYLRKLCYEKITMDDGYEVWSPREDRLYLLELRKSFIRASIKKDLVLKYKNVGRDAPYDIDEFVDYLYCRGDMKNDFGNKSLILSIGDRLSRCDWYSYNSPCDRSYFGNRFFSREYLGYKDNYFGDVGVYVDTDDMLSEYAFCDARFDKEYDILVDLEKDRTTKLQQSFDLKQRLKEKKIFSRFV